MILGNSTCSRESPPCQHLRNETSEANKQGETAALALCRGNN